MEPTLDPAPRHDAVQDTGGSRHHTDHTQLMSFIRSSNHDEIMIILLINPKNIMAVNMRCARRKSTTGLWEEHRTRNIRVLSKQQSQNNNRGRRSISKHATLLTLLRYRFCQCIRTKARKEVCFLGQEGTMEAESVQRDSSGRVASCEWRERIPNSQIPRMIWFTYDATAIQNTRTCYCIRHNNVPVTQQFCETTQWHYL
jgi:hypothetical protein